MTNYEIPSWAGKPPSGLHLDVLKDDKLIQKLMIDGKKCFFFGRNAILNDVCIDHASCSRVHSALVYHKFLNIAYLVDLGSTHGTFIGSIRIESHKPTQLQINSKFHFGASTRKYILRERITNARNIMEELPISETDAGLMGLPESQTELDNLTEYNTAHNRRISMLGITEDTIMKKNANKNKRKRNVHFNEDEIIINPEDVDPSVGRFRNLVQTTVIPSASASKKIKLDLGISAQSHHHIATTSASELAKNLHPISMINLYQGLNPPSDSKDSNTDGESSNLSLSSKLGLLLPNPAPDVTPVVQERPAIPTFKKPTPLTKLDTEKESSVNEPKKKKYAKEAWPGRKPLLGSL